ncbi:putative fructose-1-phosphate kinase [Corynebacterium kutscheri]|uniref:1-phosphofructokinase n=1 Tax=Corynebacterium kutscheri TaxID=35755 RepID=A0A0F6TDM5_9CORY|nr:1-phosphofructokinase family hexose kinase [Corynebacterium kutscheri]AKE41396.1 1-phosphofructokinase [Corynebacterium kutscheri]VEH08673.1 putative fructose-1-phosphate kinase [Corynebacterium kutscheri]VEH09720.1 putative fructose-1-phosphate kinase [Corynebacterium kutscheri]VEH79803.1 putative fructose-1-phosphate kinase [Corynebacterium kutscheri]
MIVTLTPNPSIDATFNLGTTLERGQVHRLTGSQRVAGGKGINVSGAVLAAAKKTIALFPAAADDPFITLVKNQELPCATVSVTEPVRVNTAITETDGTTTKLNGQGATLTEQQQRAVEKLLIDHCAHAEWAVLAGSLPPGVPQDWYAQLTQLLYKNYPNIKVAIDTSDAPLIALSQQLESTAPSILKPNGMELGQLVGVNGLELEAQAEKGNYLPVIEAARKMVVRGVEHVLVTLGSAGAVLVTTNNAWVATPPPAKILSTVGAGDCTLAGFIMAHTDGKPLDECLRQGVAYGTAAASLPGTTIPTPDQVNIAETTIRTLV